MRKLIKIGKKEYKTKKEALLYFKKILNFYDFGEFLNENDFDDLLGLLKYSRNNYYLSNFENLESNIDEENDKNDKCSDIKIQEESGIFFARRGIKKKIDSVVIENIRVSKVQFGTKCFEVMYSDKTRQYISYVMIINNKQFRKEELFNIACRNSIYEDLRSVKKEFFYNNSINGEVKCQETNKLSKWSELVIDHRQPNTFSIIVDRFKEIQKIKVESIEYIVNLNNQIIFKDEELNFAFKRYHRDKATLILVRKECNLSRSGMARVKKIRKDLVIK